MQWAVFGAHGMLGQDIMSLLSHNGQDAQGFDRRDLDITDQSAIEQLALGSCDVVVNCAAWTNVDEAETHEDEAYEINALGAQNLALLSKRCGARFVQISTDYVFDGQSSSPYAEDAPTAPRSAYGRTKEAGERAAMEANPSTYIVRTAWLYGAHGKCFPKTIATAGRTRDALTVVNDQIGQPTWTVDVARIVSDLVSNAAPFGVYHATSSGRCSWFDFARAVLTSDGQDPDKISPSSSNDLDRLAPRPAFSVLGHEAFTRAGIEPIGQWDSRWEQASESVLADL